MGSGLIVFENVGWGRSQGLIFIDQSPRVGTVGTMETFLWVRTLPKGQRSTDELVPCPAVWPVGRWWPPSPPGTSRTAPRPRAGLEGN